MKTFLATLALLGGLTLTAAPAMADDGVYIQHRPYHHAYRHRKVPVTRCHWYHNRRICHTVWVRR